MNINQKGFANIILVVVIVLLVGAGGYFAFVKKSEPIAKQPTPTATLDKTSNWKTYHNDGGGYSFKYPLEWQLTTVTSVDGNVESPYSFKTAKGEIAFSVTHWDYNGTLEEFFQKQVAGFKNSEGYWVGGVASKEGLSVDEKSAKKAYVDIGSCREVNIFTKNNNQLYSFVFNERCTSGAVDSEASENLIQILSTFKFIEPMVDISNWKTYNNLGFSIKYPSDWTEVEYPANWSGSKNGEYVISIYGSKADLASITITYYPSLENLPLNPVTNKPYEYFEQYVMDSHFFKDQKLISLNSGTAQSAISVLDTTTHIMLVGGNGHFYEVSYRPRYNQTLEELERIIQTFQFTK